MALVTRTIEGEREAFETLDIPGIVAVKIAPEVPRVIQAASIPVRDRAIKIVQGGLSITGELERSIRLKPINTLADGFDGGIEATAPHAATKEFGRSAGKPHPPGSFITAPAYTTMVSGHRRGTSSVRPHPRIVQAVEVWKSVMDDWLRDPRGGNVPGDDPQALRKRAAKAYLVGRGMKEKGTEPFSFMAEALRQVGDEALEIFDRLMAELISRETQRIIVGSVV